MYEILIHLKKLHSYKISDGKHKLNLKTRLNLQTGSGERITHQAFGVHLYLPTHFWRSQIPQVPGIPMLVIHPTVGSNAHVLIKNFAGHDNVADPACYAHTHT